MKNIMKTIAAIVLIANTLCIKAQNFQNGALILDDKLMPSNNVVDCYNFKKVQVAFPITKELFAHDGVEFTVKMSNSDTSFNVKFEYLAGLRKQEFFSNFEGKKVGVITLVDENRSTVKSPYSDKLGPLTVKEFHTCTTKGLKYKPVEVGISVIDITGYEEKYNEYSKAFERKPVYGREKYLLRILLKFKDPVVPASYSAIPLAKMLGKSKIKAEEEEQNKKLTNCTLNSVKQIEVKMNTDVDIDTFYGHIASSDNNSSEDSGSLKGNLANINGVLKSVTEKHSNGKVKVQGQNNADGNQEGTWKYFNEAGKLEKIENYKGGIMHGEWKYYDEAGKLVKTEKYNEGELVE